MAKRKAASRQSAKRKAAKKAPKRKSVSPVDRLRKVLGTVDSSELIEAIVELARCDTRVLRQVQDWFNVDESMSSDELLHATRLAICDATDFDERQMNHNFDYDYRAYEVVLRNFGKLVESGHLADVMKVSLDLMKQGSYQVEMSDEGMMTDEIEDCIRVVIEAVQKFELPLATVGKWCQQMLANDRCGFLCQSELNDLLQDAK